MTKGKLIVIEGTDCSGKQTQSELLFEKLKSLGHDCEIISFPKYGTPTGDIVGDCYLGKGKRVEVGSWFGDADKLDPKIACLYYAADRKAAALDIKDKLDGGKIIILDRYVESNMGHQCGKLLDEEERAKLRDWIEKLEYGLLELPRPDLIIFLYMPFEAAEKLKGDRGEVLDSHESNENHLRNAEKSYLELSEFYDWRKVLCSEDGRNARTIEDIHNEVFRVVSNYVSSHTS